MSYHVTLAVGSRRQIHHGFGGCWYFRRVCPRSGVAAVPGINPGREMFFACVPASGWNRQQIATRIL